MKNQIDLYIESAPPSVREKLIQIRQLISKNAPQATEGIKYGMPTFILNGNLVHFAVFKNHIGFYPTPSAINMFKNDIAKYKWSKGSIQFPLTEDLPSELIVKIVKFRVSENLKRKIS
jgi:uncharacterized protein YdhG (YjbR/CyaY superfamily)